MVKYLKDVLKTDKDNTVILIRFIVGYIFVMEGIQKFMHSETLGVGRFIKIGIPFPELMAPFVGSCEIIFGICILLGLFVRLAAIPTIIIMLTAIATTKLSVLSEKGLLTFSHDSRNDLLMLFGLIFLFIKGAGSWSLDQILHRDT